MSIKNTIRNVLNIRKERSLLPPGPQPQIGSSIVRERLKIRLKYHITAEQWDWFTEHGWRTIDMRTNRREYTSVPDKVLVKLLDLEGDPREVLHQRLFRKSTVAKVERAAKAEKAARAEVKSEDKVGAKADKLKKSAAAAEEMVGEIS
jgi:hypothetical protein